jgi:Flp pilus assembly protein CpaB
VSVGARNRNPTYILIAGIVVALLGGILVVVLLSQQGQVTIPGQTVSVVVAAHDISPRTQVNSSDLTTVAYPANAVPSRSFSSTTEVKGFAAVGIAKNTPVTADLLVSAPAAAPSGSQGVLNVPQGEVAIAIPAGDPINNVAGFVQSGDHVDILARNLPGQTPGQVATTFTNLTIQLVNGSTAGGRAPSGNTWVVFVQEKQAEQLVYLFNNAQYWFVLRSQADNSAGGSAPSSVGGSDFNGAFGIH